MSEFFQNHLCQGGTEIIVSEHPFPQPANVRITYAKGEALVPHGDIGLQKSEAMHSVPKKSGNSLEFKIRRSKPKTFLL